jgi:hypothetical protein
MMGSLFCRRYFGARRMIGRVVWTVYHFHHGER